MIDNNSILQRQTSEEENAFQTITKETKYIKKEFAKLQGEVRKKIKSIEDSKSRLIEVVEDLGILRGDDIQRVDEAEDVLGVFRIIKKFWSLLDYEYFEHIVENLCGDQEMKMLHEYTAKLRKFCEKSKVHCLPIASDDHNDDSLNKLYIRLNLKCLNVSQNLLELKSSFANILGCDASNLVLLSIESGSILLVFFVVVFDRNCILEKGPDSLSSEQQEALKRKHVISLEYNSITIFCDPKQSLHPNHADGEFKFWIKMKPP